MSRAVENKPDIYHPKDTAKIFRNHSKADHLWYLLHYQQDVSEEKGVLKFGKKKSGFKNNSLSEIIRLAQAAEKRRECALNTMESYQYLRVFQMKGSSLMVHGLGGSHVTDNSLTIHPVYGVPCLPASSVKGVVRRWFVDALFEGEVENLKNAQTPKAVLGRALFGTGDQQGMLQFYDILFHEGLEIKVDILTPHFSEYYSGKNSPNDTLSPVPNTFYAVKVASAKLMLTLHKHKLADLLVKLSITATQLMTMLESWVSAAFRELGAGGKTSSGYGRFTKLQEVYGTPIQEDDAFDREMEGLTPEEQLILKIGRLTPSDEDMNMSKTDIYRTVVGTKNVEGANLLRQYWMERASWGLSAKKMSKKQADRCKIIQDIIVSAET